MAVSFAEGTPDVITYVMTANVARPVTLSAWVKPSTTGTYIAIWQTVGINNMLLRYDAGTTKFSAVMTGSATLTATEGGTSAAGSWYHIMAQYDDSAGPGSDVVLLWVDGTLEGSASGTVSGMGTLARMTFGAAKTNGDPATGSLAEVALWSGSGSFLFLPDQGILDGLARGVPVNNIPFGYRTGGEMIFWDRLIAHDSSPAVRPRDGILRASGSITSGAPAHDSNHPRQIFNRRLAA